MSESVYAPKTTGTPEGACVIFPPPVKDGREYLFHESAVKVDLNRPVTGSLLKRIRNGKKAKS
ncbi:excisionase [Escherichia coli]|uniref:excisionase n=1 Tax=Escherichia coli TaxID=562 RepID=UPI00201D86B2|nr:excisionase [Escherichia coli]